MEALVKKVSEFEFDADNPRTRVYVAVEQTATVQGIELEHSTMYAFRAKGHIADKFPIDTVIRIELTDEWEVRPKKDVTAGIKLAEFKGFVQGEK